MCLLSATDTKAPRQDTLKQGRPCAVQGCLSRSKTALGDPKALTTA